MKLNDKYSIEVAGSGFALVEKTRVEIRKDKKMTGKFKNGTNRYFYGTVYQTLKGFLQVSVDNSIKSNTDIMEEVGKALFVIDQANKMIKTEFCIEVKIVKP